MIRPPPTATPLYSSAASDVYKRQVHIWPVAHKRGVAREPGISGIALFIIDNAWWRYTIDPSHHCRQCLHRLGRSDRDSLRIVRIEHGPAVAIEHLYKVADEPFVLRALPEIAIAGMSRRPDLPGHSAEFIPGRRRCSQQILAIIDNARIRTHRHGPDASVKCACLNGAGEILCPLV